MKFFHISDLHLGKRVCGFSMLEDQKHILQQILELAQQQRPQGVWIAGDLYDRQAPPAEAVELADWFLSQLAGLRIPVWAISGNHDSAERVAYGSRMMEQAGVFMSRVFDGTLQRYTVEDCADIYLMPYLRPAQVRRFFPDRTIETAQQAAEAVLERTELRENRVNILLMHQFLAGAAVCDSEELSVGGIDQIDASVVDQFDYVALGHLHRPQCVGRETVRYCGSPLKYSFSEAGHDKSLTVVEIKKKEEMSRPGVETNAGNGRTPDGGETMDGRETPGDGKTAGGKKTPGNGETVGGRRTPDGGDAADGKKKPDNEDAADGRKMLEGEDAADKISYVTISTIPLRPRLDLREIRGPIEKLLQPEIYLAANPQDYLHITLTDEHEVLDAIGRLREVYPNIMRLDFESAAFETSPEPEILPEEQTPQELFETFFLQQNGRKLDEEQRAVVDEILRQAE